MPKRKLRTEVLIEEAADTTNWFDYTVAELKLELEARGLSKAGRKNDLISRLEASDNGTLPTDESAPKPKRTKKAPSPEVEIEGPLASNVVQYQDVSRSGERRLRPFEAEPDETYKKKLKKIRKERMFMLDRTKSLDRDGFACEIFDIAGSTGNIYQTTIGRKPNCTCMDAVRLQIILSRAYILTQCRESAARSANTFAVCFPSPKFFPYNADTDISSDALIIILKAPAYLCYQKAFLSEELASIFANAPVTRAAEHELNHEHSFGDNEDQNHAGNRKPIDGECPICVFDMDPNENIVWCKASCGQNFHKDCFEQWKRSKNGGRVTCVYCRAEWQEDGVVQKKHAPGSLASLKESAPKIGSYRNIGHHAMYQQGK